MFSCKATQRSTQALSDARGACVAERFAGAHPPSRAGPLSDYKVAVDASVRRRSGRMCHRKVRWRSSFPAELGPFRSQGHGRPCLSAAHAPRALCFTGICAGLYYACIFLRKSLMVFCMRQVMVIGPTPPGTGVITDAIGSTAS